MNKIINGKRYDTESAKSLAGWENIPYVSDFSWYQEVLFQKRTGEYFLYGTGNANSKYCESIGNNSWCGGEKIIPLTVDKAREWAEEHLNGDEYEKIFTVEEESKRILTLSLSEKTIETIRLRSQEAGISMSSYIDNIIAQTAQ